MPSCPLMREQQHKEGKERYVQVTRLPGVFFGGVGGLGRKVREKKETLFTKRSGIFCTGKKIAPSARQPGENTHFVAGRSYRHNAKGKPKKGDVRQNNEGIGIEGGVASSLVPILGER